MAYRAAPFLLILALTTLSADAREDRWRGTHAAFELGPTLRRTHSAIRPGIPSSVGVQAGLEIRRSLGRVVFLSASSEWAFSGQIGSRSNAAVGDWSGSELQPFIPGVGFNLKRTHFVFSYPLFGTLVLVSRAANGDAVKYSGSQFFQATAYFETALGLLGAQYRTGTFNTETAGATVTNLNPKLEVSAFTIFFGFFLF